MYHKYYYNPYVLLLFTHVLLNIPIQIHQTFWHSTHSHVRFFNHTLLSPACVLFNVRSRKSRVRLRATPELNFAVILLRGGGRVFLAALAPGNICTALDAK